jgi:hypothetical protein
VSDEGVFSLCALSLPLHTGASLRIP